MTQRQQGGRTADAGPAALLRVRARSPAPTVLAPTVLALSVLALTVLAVTAGCAGPSGPVTIGPAPAGAAPGCALEDGKQVCATGGTPGSGGAAGPSGTARTPAPSGSSSGTGAVPATRTATTAPAGKATAWGGGRRVGTYRTTGTVDGLRPGTVGARRVGGTCDVARDVRTVTATVDATATLVIDVTGRNIASVTLRVRGGTTWAAEYVGPSADNVATLTPTRTRVRGARLVRVSGPAADPVVVDADFDC